MDFDNPAYRLLTLLEEGKRLDQNLNCRQAWSKLLNVRPESPELFVRIGKVMELPSLTVSAIRFTYPDEPDTWSHWVSQVQAGFNGQVLNQTWSTFINMIDHHSINYLKIHSRLLQVKSKLKPLDEDVLNGAKTGLTEVLDLLLASEDIDKEIRVALSRNIRKLINAIEEYKLTGSAGIFDSIEVLFGHAYFDPKYAQVIKESTLGEKVAQIVGVLADSMTIALGLPQATESAKALLAYVEAAT